jgi:hypothetical protein
VGSCWAGAQQEQALGPGQQLQSAEQQQEQLAVLVLQALGPHALVCSSSLAGALSSLGVSQQGDRSKHRGVAPKLLGVGTW